MNKRNFVKRISEQLSVPQQDVHHFIDAFKRELMEILKEDGHLVLQGFGSFHLWMQSEREGRNPKTGEKCMIRSRSSVKFKPGKKMLENLNGQVIPN